MTISHFVHTLRAYAPVILFTTAAVALVYVVVAVALYIFSPAQRVTTQKFRLDFEGATEGKYPNGLKFTSGDIVSTPILLDVYKEDQLDRFTSFPNFNRAVFVLEANPEYERVAAEYQSRLADPRLSAIDRERILREWQSKTATVAKNDYAINWVRTPDTTAVPETVVRKALLDTLKNWARYAANEEHVLQYQLSVLSPQTITLADGDGEPEIAIQVLRSKIYKILQNIDDLRAVPGSELVRSGDGMSLEEIRLRLEEIVRFRLEPLAGRVANSGLIQNRAATLRFLESQLAYDQRLLKATQDRAENIRQTLSVYANDQRSAIAEAAAAPPKEPRPQVQRPDTVTPQITESFLDRLVSLTTQSSDAVYRQKLADQYRVASQAIVPVQQAVSYDQDVLTVVKSGGAAASADAASVRGEIAGTQSEVKQLVGRVNEIYRSISSNLSPSKELYTPTAPPVARTEHSRSLSQLALYGVALVALSLPLTTIFCLIHARVREEDATEAYLAATAA